MIFRYASLLVAAALLLLSAACSPKESSNGSVSTVSNTVLNVEPAQLVRLDNLIAAGGNAIPEVYESPMEVYMQMLNRYSGNLAEDVDSFRLDDAFAMFYEPTYQEFTSTDDIEHSLGRVNNYLADQLPEISSQVYYGIVSPRIDNRIITYADTATYIVLNFYLGKDFEAYAGFPEYKKLYFERRRIPADVVEAVIAQSYKYTPSENSTLLSRLLYYGALTKVVVDASGVSLADYLGWTPEQMDYATANERLIWLKMASDNLIYSTNPADADRLFNPAPNASIITNETPGQIGRYIGYKIIESYLAANPRTKIQSLLLDTFYDNPTSLPSSNYAP